MIRKRNPRMNRGARLVLAGAVVFGLVLVPALSASAATAGSNWWQGWYDVAGAQAAGWTGAGIKVAVIDGQINSSLPVFQGANLKIYPTSFCNDTAPVDTTTANEVSVHGSDVTALLVGNGTGTGSVAGIAPKAIVSFYADGNSDGTLNGCPNTQSDGLTYSTTGRAILRAIADGNRIISISQMKPSSTAGDTQAVAKGIAIIAAQPNTAAEATFRFPADANGVVGTNAFDDQGNLQSHDGKTTAYSSTTVVAAGAHLPSQASLAFVWGDNANSVTGSSLATPLVAGMLALTLQKYPSATGNQLIQSLIVNTTAKDHALSFDTAGYGYGPASLSHLLRVDPTRYPDTNPLLNKPNGLGVPTAAEFAAAANGSSPTPSASPSAAAAAPSPGKASGSILPGLLTGVIVVVVLLLVLAGLAVVLVRSLRRKAIPSTPASVGPNSVVSNATASDSAGPAVDERDH
jgi:subtilase family serine protease